MPKTALSKMALQKEREHLKLYERILPSLDLKRLQLTGALARAKQEAIRARDAARRHSRQVAEKLPMMANRQVNLSGLVQVTGVRQETENLLGVALPRFVDLEVTVAPYSIMGTPVWMDVFVNELIGMLRIRAEIKVADSRVAILARAVRRVTQRINLFEKILIPQAKANIKRIKVYLGDQERSAIVRAKIAKAKRRRERLLVADSGAAS